MGIVSDAFLVVTHIHSPSVTFVASTSKIGLDLSTTDKSGCHILVQQIVISCVGNGNRLPFSSLFPQRPQWSSYSVNGAVPFACWKRPRSLEQDLDGASQHAVSQQPCSVSFSPGLRFFSHTDFSAPWCQNFFCFRAFCTCNPVFSEKSFHLCPG